MIKAIPLMVALGWAATSGCMSTHVVKNKAQRHAEYDAVKQRQTEVEGAPGYYALLALTIPADVVTYPLQIIFFEGGTSSASAHIDGWPVPLW